MKTSAIALALVAALAAGTTFAGAAFAESEQQKLKDVHHDNRAIHHDNQDIRADKRDIGKDKRDLANDRAARNSDQKREDQAIEHGNVRGAEKWDQRRRAEQADVDHDKRDLRKDDRDLNHDRADRNSEVAKRDRDASKL